MSEQANGVSPETTQQPVENNNNNNDTATETNYDRSKPYFDDKVGKAIQEAMQDPAVREAEQKLESLNDIQETHLEGATEAKVSYSQVMKEASPEVKAVLKHFHADYTRKMQEIARIKEQYTSQQDAMLSSDYQNKLKEAAEKDVAFDPYDEKTYQAAIEKEVARRLQEMLKPVEEQMQLRKHEMKVEDFKRANPDWSTYKKEMYTLMVGNESMSVEQAYKLAKADAIVKSDAERAEELKQYRTVAREAGLKVGGTRRERGGGVPAHVRKQGARAVYEYLERQNS